MGCQAITKPVVYTQKCTLAGETDTFEWNSRDQPSKQKKTAGIVKKRPAASCYFLNMKQQVFCITTNAQMKSSCTSEMAEI